MKNRFTLPHLLAVGSLATASLHATLDINYVGQVSLPGGGEIVSYTRDNFTLATTYFTGSGVGATQGVNLYNFNGGSTSFRATADFSSLFGQSNTASVSSVALDPLGRGFGVATVIPTANTTTQSKLAFFDYNSGALLHTIDTGGYHADSVNFSHDGSRIVIANEGEANPGTSAANDGTDAPGSLSIISLAGITSAAQVSSISSVVNRDFSAPNLGPSASLSGVRNPYIAAVGNPGNSAGQQTFISSVPNFTNPANISHTGIEPEYAVVHGGKAYVSLQENNAIGVMDLNTNQWEKIHKLGTITQTIDATDSDGAANISKTVKGLPMPDTISVVTIGGRDYIVTANEGDARIDDRDVTRFGDTSGGDSLNPILDPSLVGSPTRANTELGRLNVSRIDGDTNGDGKIDEAVMIGTRSFAIWDAETGALISDSGSLESQLLLLDPSRHNINREGTTIDNRSDDKGPEPEALTVFNVDSLTYAAIGLERQNGILVYDITDPASPFFVDYVNSADNGLISPESLLFISAADSPTGTPFLIGGLEGIDGTGGQAGLGIYGVNVIPEPSTYALMVGLATLGLALYRRRFQSKA